MSNAARQRRLRARQRRGEIVAPVPINADVIETAIDLGWLAERDSECRAQIAAALARMLCDLAAAHKRKNP